MDGLKRVIPVMKLGVWILATAVAVWGIGAAVRYGPLWLAQRDAQADLTTWLEANAQAADTVMAERPLGAWPHVPLAHIQLAGQMTPLRQSLAAEPPTWIVSDGTLAWQVLAQDAWFADQYQAVYERPPYTIWHHTP